MALPSGRAPSSSSAGARIGRVAAVTGEGVLVEVPALVKGYQYGPARIAEGLSVRTTAGASAGDHGTHAHQHGRALEVGDEVLVVFLGDSRTELVIIDRLLPAS